MSARPLPTLAMRRRHRVTGEPFLVAVVAEQVVLPPGTELHLRRIADDDSNACDGATHALQIVPPAAPGWEPTRAERARAAADDLRGCAIRRDPRDSDREEPAPW